MCAVSVAGVVLAAGFSRRLGRPKQLVEIGGETLLARAVRVAWEADLSPIFVVINANDPITFLNAELGCTVILNSAAEEGIASSIRAGVHALFRWPELAGAVLMTCDQFGARPAHLRSLYADPHRLTGSGYAGKVAVPAYFPASGFAELLALRGDTGARELLRQAHVIEAQELGLDIDTEEDVMRARDVFEQGGLL